MAVALAVLIPLCAQNHGNAQGNIQDKWVKRVNELVGNHKAPEPSRGSYGMDSRTGKFIHPETTFHTYESHPFDGLLDYWDKEQYIKNMKVEAYYPITVEPFHTWQNMVDFNGRRYLYQYVRRDLKIYDITNPKDVKLLLTRGHTWGGNGPDVEEQNPYPKGDMFGAASIQWNEKLGKYIMVQSFEIQRFGVLHDKLTEPDKVDKIRHADHLKGFKVYEMNGPLPNDWKLIAERTQTSCTPMRRLDSNRVQACAIFPLTSVVISCMSRQRRMPAMPLPNTQMTCILRVISLGTCQIHPTRNSSIS